MQIRSNIFHNIVNRQSHPCQNKFEEKSRIQVHVMIKDPPTFCQSSHVSCSNYPNNFLKIGSCILGNVTNRHTSVIDTKIWCINDICGLS